MKKIPNLQQEKSYDTTFDFFMQWFLVSLLVMKDDFSRVPDRLKRLWIQVILQFK